MAIILAHRGNVDGPSPTGENRLSTITTAFERGYGIETDIRRARDGRFYLSHDPAEAVDDLLAADVFRVARAHPSATIALNVKEIGYEAELLTFLAAERVLDQCVLFDMELIESRPGETARLFHRLNRSARIAARVSDRDEPLDRAFGIPSASVVWLDEFAVHWATEADITRLKAAGLTVFAVSPDLHHFSLESSRARWRDFCRWGVDAICTDYATDLARLLATIEECVTA